LSGIEIRCNNQEDKGRTKRGINRRGEWEREQTS
jgi:hypothetical protein